MCYWLDQFFVSGRTAILILLQHADIIVLLLAKHGYFIVRHCVAPVTYGIAARNMVGKKL
jgi:hypothetical protein